jgi:hypothetical protein
VMFETLCEFKIRNGLVLECYTVYRDGGDDIFIQNVLDAQKGHPSDVIHIDRQALRPIALALLAAAASHPDVPSGDPIAVRFPQSPVVMIPPLAANVISLLDRRPHP